MTEEEIMEAIDSSMAYYPAKEKLEFLDRLKVLIGYRYQAAQDLINEESGKRID